MFNRRATKANRTVGTSEEVRSDSDTLITTSFEPSEATAGAGTSSPSGATVMFRRACDDCAEENFRLDELSEMTGGIDKQTEFRPQYCGVKKMSKNDKFVGSCKKVVSTEISAEKSDLFDKIQQLKRIVREKTAQMDQFQNQQQNKLDAQCRMQDSYNTVTVQMKANQKKRQQASSENRCLKGRDSKLSQDINSSKKEATEHKTALQEAVNTRLDLQQKLHDQGKLHNQKIDGSRSKLMDTRGHNRTASQSLSLLEADVDGAKQSLSDGARHLTKAKRKLEEQRCDRKQGGAKRQNVLKSVAKFQESLSKRKEAVSEILTGKLAAEKLLMESRLEAQRHHTRGSVIEAGISGQQDIVELLDCETKRLTADETRLRQKVSAYQGQHDQLLNLVSARQKSLECGKSRLQQLQKRLQQLQQQYCSRMSAPVDHMQEESPSLSHL